MLKTPYPLEINTLHYQAAADTNFQIFLKEEPYLLEIPHYHESIELAAILCEETVVHLGEQKTKLTAGDIFFIDSFRVHHYEYYKSGIRAIVLVLSKEYTALFHTLYPNLTFHELLADKEKNKVLLQLLENWLNEDDKTVLLNYGYAQLFFDKLIKLYGLQPVVNNHSDPIAAKFLNYINENYAKQISLETMAQHFGYSVGRCSYLFNTGIGVSFKTHLNNVRMAAAQKMMEENKYTIQEIMQQCGYRSAVTFYRQLKSFKNHTVQ